MNDRSSIQDPPFRIIVIGGGIAGLTASHCLQKAGIEHVVLERRQEIAPAEGASIAIYPHGARILQQIGCLDAVELACTPCERWWARRTDGKIIMDNGFFDYVRENHGKDILLLERRRLLEILYGGLPDKTRIRTGCQVKDVSQSVSGVEVTLQDGTVEKGDMVLGCDGVYSLTRSIMWQHADKMAPGLIPLKERACIKTNWKALIGLGPAMPELGERDMTVVHNTNYSFLALTQPDRVFWFVFFRLPETLEWPKRANYTDQDAESLAASVADHPVCDSLVFGDLWRKRDRGALIPIEEGILDHWHFGRVVLAGDAVHKLTPNIALGGNSTMESVVVLCNHIQRMMVLQQGAKPSRATLGKAFSAYREERFARVKEIMDFSSTITKVQAWDNIAYKFVANWVLPLIPDRSVADYLGQIIKGAPKLDYVELTDFPKGRMSWKNENEGGKGLKPENIEHPRIGWVTELISY